jgi:hypothetical protein
MDPTLISVGIALGGGAIGAAVIGVMLLAVRGSILKGVQNAAEKELETMRAKFTESLEEKRQAFARELERERQEAARALEIFKAELGEKAEMRRQVIAKRLAALEEISAAGEPLVRDAGTNAKDVSGKISVLNHFAVVMRQHSHILSPGLQRNFFERAARIELALEKTRHLNQPDEILEAWKAGEELMRSVRSELGIEEVNGAASRPPANHRTGPA